MNVPPNFDHFLTFPLHSRSTASTSEYHGFLLFMQAREKFLKTSVGQNSLRRVERAAKLIVAPDFVDEILT
jgi:hypothetical protein